MRLRRRREPVPEPLSEQEAAETDRARRIAGRIVHAGRESVLGTFAETGTIVDLTLARQEVDIALMFAAEQEEIDDVVWLGDWLDALAARLRSV